MSCHTCRRLATRRLAGSSALAAMCFLFAVRVGVTAAEDAAPLNVFGLPRNVFAEANVDVELTLREPPAAAARIVWAVETPQRRNLMRGEAAVAAGETRTRIRCKFPPLDDGVVLALRFHAAVVGASATVERKLWVFPRAAWVGRPKTLGAAKIVLFDPEETTAEHLTAADVPFTPTTNTAVLNDSRDSLILVGEGIEFQEYPELAATLWQAARAGNRVICLSPAGGTLVFSEAANDGASSVTLSRRGVLAELDPRFDDAPWTVDGSLKTTRFVLHGDGNVPSLEVSPEAAAWPWFEARFAPGGGRLTVCGFSLFAGWEETPTARYLLVHLLTADLGSTRASTTSER